MPDPRFDPNAPTLILSPHFDDAVFDCWSVLTDPDREVVVANVFAGSPRAGYLAAADRMQELRDSAELVVRRIAEDAKALALVGCRPQNLAIPEFKYRVRQVRIPRWLARFARRPGRRTVKLPFASDAHDIHETVFDEVSRIADAWSLLCAPAGIGGHPDHHVARAVALRLCRGAGIPLRLYADLPYACADGWPSWAGVGQDAQDEAADARIEGEWSRTSRPFTGMLPWRDGSLVILDADAVANKRRAVQCYATQIAPLDALVAGRMSDSATWGIELFWNVRCS